MPSPDPRSCHPERSEWVPVLSFSGFFVALRMTSVTSLTVVQRSLARGEGKLAARARVRSLA